MDSKACVRSGSGGSAVVPSLKLEPRVKEETKGEMKDKAWLSLPLHGDVSAPRPPERKFEQTPGTKPEITLSVLKFDGGYERPRRRRAYILRCFGCGERGHKKYKCPYRNRQQWQQVYETKGRGKESEIKREHDVKRERRYETELVLFPSVTYTVEQIARFDLFVLLDQAGLTSKPSSTYGVTKPCVSHQDGSWLIDGGSKHYGNGLLEHTAAIEFVKQCQEIVQARSGA